MINYEKLRRCMQIAARRRIFILLAAAGGFAAQPSAPATAESGGVAEDAGRAQCWTPAQLRSRPEERLIHRERSAPDLSQLEKFRPGTPPSAKLRGSIRRVRLPPGKMLVALTFDLCEAEGEVAGYDGAIVDYLRANRVSATFFAGGKWLISHHERGAQLLADPLFEVGNHSWSHKNLRVLHGAEMESEVTLASAAYANVAGEVAVSACMRDHSQGLASQGSAGGGSGPRLFRFPFGVCSRESLDAVANAGMVAIQWDVVTGDPFRGTTADAIAREVLRVARPGSIIVAHANGRGWNTAAALQMFVPALRAKGYRFVTVSELLAAGEPEAVSDCYEMRPGDNARYDMLSKAGGGRKHTGALKSAGVPKPAGGAGAAPDSGMETVSGAPPEAKPEPQTPPQEERGAGGSWFDRLFSGR